MFKSKAFIVLFAGIFLFAGCVSGGDNAVDGDLTAGGTEDLSSEDATFVDPDAGRAPQGGNDEELLVLQDMLNEIVLSGELERCEELNMEQFFTNCEVIILSGRANSAEDTGVCESATNDAIKLRCQAAVAAL